MTDRADLPARLRERARFLGSVEDGAMITEAAERIEALEAALKPFADIDGEGDEDFPDGTAVVVQFGRSTVYAPLSLGDFRRARAALTPESPQ